jgi:hypothetical protein
VLARREDVGRRGGADTDTQLAVLTDVVLDALVVVDLTSGERVLFSR